MALSAENVQHKTELEGGKVNWSSVMRNFIGAEYTEKAEALWEKIDSYELLEGDWQLYLEYHLKMAVNHLFNNQKEKASKHIKDFNKFVYTLMVERINANVDTGEQPIITVNFNYRIQNKNPNYEGVYNYKNFIVTLCDFCETRQGFVDPNEMVNLKDIIKLLNELKFYLESLDSLEYGRINLEDYIKLREGKIPDIQKFRTTFIEYNKNSSSHQLEELVSMIIELERSVLKEIIKE